MLAAFAGAEYFLSCGCFAKLSADKESNSRTIYLGHHP